MASSKVYRIKSGASNPALATVLKGTRAPVDLTGATVTFAMRRYAGSVPVGDLLGGACVIGDPVKGQVSYTWAEADTETPGLYRSEFNVTFPDTTLRTVPNDSYRLIEVVANVTDVFVDPDAPAFVSVATQQEMNAVTARVLALEEGGGGARTFTFGVDEGWDFGEGWFDELAPEGPPSTANRAVVTPDTITFYVSAIAAQMGVDQTGAFFSPTIVLPSEFLVDPFFAGGALDYFIIMFDTTGQHAYFGQGIAFFETVDVDDDRWSIYMADAVLPEVLADDVTGEVINSVDFFASVGSDGVIYDNIQVYLYGTVIRNLGAL